jgi:hypothetical protein
MDIIMISGACCIPTMSDFDEEARKIIDEAISMTGVQAKISMITASAAFASGAYHEIIKKGIGISDAPVILIDGEVISYGVPQIEDVKNALVRFSGKSHGE